MFLIRLCLLVCVNLFFYAKGSIPVERLCANSACNEPISEARGTVEYNAPEKGVLSFHKGDTIIIFSKGKSRSEYWGAVIKGKFGFVPPGFVKEVKLFRADADLISVVAPSQNDSIETNSTKTNTQDPKKKEEVGKQPSQTVGATPTAEKPIKPAGAYSVIEGTTIHFDEVDEIKPSATVDLKSTQTAAPSKVNKETGKQEERATIPPELIDLNSSINGQNLGNGSKFTIENVKENDENTKIESKDINVLGEEEDEGDEYEDEEEEEEEDEEEEEEGEDAVNELKLNADEELKEIKLEKSPDPASNEKLSTASPTGVDPNLINSTDSIETLLTSKENISNEIVTPVVQKPETQLPQQPIGVPGLKFGKPQAIISELHTAQPEQKGMPQMEAGVYASTPQSKSGPEATTTEFMGIKGAEASSLNSQVGVDEVTAALKSGFGAEASPEIGVKAGTETTGAQGSSAATQGVKIGSEATPPLGAGVDSALPGQKGMQGGVYEATTTHFMGIKVAEASSVTPQVVSDTTAAGFGAEASSVAPQAGVETSVPVTPKTVETAGSGPVPQTDGSAATPQIQEHMRAEASSATPQAAGTEATPQSQELPPEASPASPSPETVPPHVISEGTPEHFYTTSLPIVEETSSAFSQSSVSADSLPETSGKPGMVQETAEVTVETFAATPQPIVSGSGNDFSASSPDLRINTEKGDITTEAPASFPQDVATEQSDQPKSTEDSTEQLGILSQITGMFSGWFTSAPKEDFPEIRAEYEAAFQDEKAKSSWTESPSGTCQNPEFDFDCKEFEKEQPTTSWTDWIPAGLGLENILRQSNTPIYLVVTAITVLLFTLGHNFIEKRGKTAPLIAKINKLEQELMVMSKECSLLKDGVQSAREKITLYENSANDELVVSLQAELEESKKARSELESSIEVLQQELDAATEAGLDLNKMLSEVLTQKGGSETLLKSVESLQGQLDSQQKVIDEMTKKLGVKNQENEALQSALELANDKSENLEEQLTDIKHNLNLHLKEKEDLTRDLNARINQLTTSANQLRQTKEEEIGKLKKEWEELETKFKDTCGRLTVREEEVKALKESMKHLKGKGDVKLETVFDCSRVKAELAKEVKENRSLLEKLQKEEESRKTLTEQLSGLEGELQKLKKSLEEAEQKKDEAEKKLEVLSAYFKEKETRLQKELGLQEALWAQKKGDENAVCNMMKSLQEEVESYKSQNETLKKEILDQERGLKNQIASLEQKAHENWVAARQAERKLEESKQEMAQLRNRLITVMDKNNSNAEGKGNLHSEELNGVEAASPILHDTSSPLLFPPLPLDPNGSNLLPPGFIPPPMFMPPPMGGFMPPPPFLPGDRRPPPLGRMSSPPLNNRFSPSSPGDYPFERMSSPPLSPPASNYRSHNEDREHYRHRTPPYPPPSLPRNWDDGEMPGFIPISSQRDSRRDHKGSNVSSEHSSSESLDKSSRHSGRV